MGRYTYINNSFLANELRKDLSRKENYRLIYGEYFSLYSGIKQIRVKLNTEIAMEPDRRLRPFDLAVSDVIYSLVVEEGINKISIKKIWVELCGDPDANLTANQREAIREAIHRLQSLMISIDCCNDQTTLTELAEHEGDLLTEQPFFRGELDSKDMLFLTGVEALPLYYFAQIHHEMIKVPRDLLRIYYMNEQGIEKKLSNTTDTILMKRAIIANFEVVRNEKNNYSPSSVVYEKAASAKSYGFWAEIGVDKYNNKNNRNYSAIAWEHKSQDLHHTMIKILDYYKRIHYIDGYDIDKRGRKIIGITVSGVNDSDHILSHDNFEGQSEMTNRQRIKLEAAIKETLEMTIRNKGAIYWSQQELIKAIRKRFKASAYDIEQVIGEMVDGLELSLISAADAVCEGAGVGFYTGINCEAYIARKLQILNEQTVNEETVKKVEAFIKEEGDALAEKQVEALRMAFTSNISIINGGPGTGKSYTVGKIINCGRMLGMQISVLAPTGKAARNISGFGEEITGRTIHSYLSPSAEADFDSLWGLCKDGVFAKEDESSEEDMIIVDEMSMVDVPLFYALLKTIQHGTKLVLVGDANQLPSIGPGFVFGDMVNSHKFATVKLEKLQRQAETSNIYKLANVVNKGLTISEALRNCADTKCYFDIPNKYLDAEVEEHILKGMKIVINNPKFNLEDYVILTALNEKSKTSVQNLNDKIQKLLLEAGEIEEAKACGFHVGDRVIAGRNDYSNGVFNGEVGYVRKVEDKSVWVDFSSKKEEIAEESNWIKYEDKTAGEDGKVAANHVRNLKLAYAITVHKSQGSEYKRVIVAVTSDMWTRNMLYTAITRAKESLVIYSSEKLMDKIRNDVSCQSRNTTLAHQLM